MPNAYGAIIAIIFSVFVFFINPIMNISQEQDETIRTMVYEEAKFFVETELNKGQVSEQAYNEFLKSLSLTGNVYDIKMTHYKFVLNSGDSSGLSGSDYVIHTNREILDEIYTKGFYNMSQDDYFKVEVINKNKTMATFMQEMFFRRSGSDAKIFVRYGGAVRNEAF